MMHTFRLPKVSRPCLSTTDSKIAIRLWNFWRDVGSEAYGFGLVRLELVRPRNWSDESEQDDDLQDVRNSVNLLLERIGVYQALSESATNNKSSAPHYITSVSS